MKSGARIANGVAGGVLTLLFCYSLYLSQTRIYQVDEAQNVFMARVTALGAEQQYFSNGYLFLLGPLSWIAGSATTSEAMFSGGRALFLVLYWLNLALIPFAAGLRVRSREYLFALLFVATLAPLLDYGLEIRHDNLMLALLLVAWSIVRRFEGPAWLGWCLLGATAGVLQFAAFKAFLYWLPLSLGVLLFPPPALRTGRVQRGVYWLAGLVAATLLVRLAYGTGGAWEAYVAGVRVAFAFSESAVRLSPWSTFGRLLTQTPFLLAAAFVVALWTVRRTLRRGWRTVIGWHGSLPEALLCALVTIAFLANPAPYPYNLLHWVPFVVVWLLKAWRTDDVRSVPKVLAARSLGVALLGVFALGHAATYVHSALRHLAFSNERQILLMRTAEALTDPARDRVFDASGLVASRHSIGYQWFLHSLVMNRFRTGELPPIWQEFRARPPAVVIRSYRTDWMGRAEIQFLRQHYLSLSDDLLVLGAVLPAGGGTFRCLHPGRYLLQASNDAGAAELFADGRAVKSGTVIELAAGPRVLTASSAKRVQVVWVGPRLAQPPPLSNRDHGRLFVNWY